MPLSTAPTSGTESLVLPQSVLHYPDKLVLIIEPQPSTCSQIETALQDTGYHTLAVGNCEEALAYFNRAQIDLVITDLFTSEQDSFKLLAFVKENHPNTAVIFTTNQGSVETSVAAFRQGVADYLVKPVTPFELRQSVERALIQKTDALNEELPNPLDELETLRAGIELFLNNLSQKEVLSITGSRSLQMSKADYCEIFTTHPDGKAFVSTIRLPGVETFHLDIYERSRQLASEAIRRQSRLIINKPENRPALFASWLVLPFKVSGNIIGALCLAHRYIRAFSPELIKLLSIFVDQASIAISNAQLFEDLTGAYNKLSQSRAEILESKNTLQTLFDGITDGLYIIDRELNIIMVNQAESQRLRMPMHTVLRRQFNELGWQQAAPKFIEQIRNTFDTGQKSHWIPPELNQSSLVYNREMHLYPIVSSQTTVQQVIILAQDVGAQKQLQASLFQSANLAAVGQLATGVAHEINNPLTIALTNTQLSMTELEPEDELYEVLEDTYYACNRIKDIVANLVDLSNQDVYQFGHVNLIETIEETLTLLGHSLRSAQIEVERIYHHSPVITASRSHMKMAWMNLLRNAYDAIIATNKPGKITITITQNQADQVQVSITDTGVGIPEEYKRTIFSPFFTTKPVGQGVGLGLFTVRTIIEEHEGTLGFESIPGNTCFSTRLPVSQTKHLQPDSEDVPGMTNQLSENTDVALY